MSICNSWTDQIAPHLRRDFEAREINVFTALNHDAQVSGEREIHRVVARRVTGPLQGSAPARQIERIVNNRAFPAHRNACESEDETEIQSDKGIGREGCQNKLRATLKQYSAKEKIQILLAGWRSEDHSAELFRHTAIQSYQFQACSESF